MNGPAREQSGRPVRMTAVAVAVLVGALLQWFILWKTSLPLGVPNEWVWGRLEPMGPILAMIWPALLAGAVLAFFICLNSLAFDSRRPRTRGLLVVSLWILGTCWILSLAASTPGIASLSRIPFVLFYTRASGYLTQAIEHRHNVKGFLHGYREAIADSTNPENHLHLGTHPPGLTLSLIGMLKLGEASPGLTSLVNATQPAQVQDSVDAIRELHAAQGREVPLKQVESAVIWAAALLTAILAAGTTIPLYLLARRVVSPEAAWWCASFWLLVPAVAIFLPKSDIVFPCLAMWCQYLWLRGLDSNRFAWGMATGFVMSLCLSLTLAFVPVGLVMFLQGLLLPSAKTASSSLSVRTPPRWHVYVGGFTASAIWILFWRFVGGINLVEVWAQNLRNHAAFYEHHTRSYWPWLLENPLELAFSLGLPIAILAGCGMLCLVFSRNSRWIWELGLPILIWSLLWVSGKNMGEAARLWVFLMPYPLWCSSLALARMISTRAGWRVTCLCYLLQIGVALATAVRIDGFGFIELGPPV